MRLLETPVDLHCRRDADLGAEEPAVVDVQRCVGCVDDRRGVGPATVTTFLTSHRLEEAERLCDRVAILKRCCG
jgi:hypothetical protein